MAASKKPKQQTDSSKKAVSASSSNGYSRGRKIRMAIGLIFLFAGAFTTLAIVSYFFTWQQDQNLLLRSDGLKAFISSGQEVVANWAGRLGAWLSHVLVYRGFGLASLALGLWAISMGLHIINRKRMANSLRYLRWLCLILLVAAPILTFLFPNASFPWGGAYGSEAVAYSNGFLGAAGTGLVLLCLAGFVLFVIFALDISPMIRRARLAAQKMKEGLQNMRTEKQELTQDAEDASTAAIGDEQATNKNGSTLFIDDKLEPNKAGEELPTIGEVDTSAASTKKYELQLNEKEGPDGAIDEEPTAIAEEDYEPSEEELAYQEHLAAKAIAQQNLSTLPKPTPEPKPTQAQQPATAQQPKTEPGFSFEVVQQAEQPAAASIQHGDHISIESGEPYAPELDLPDYKFPTLDLLEQRTQETIALNKEELEQNKAQIEKTLNSFGISIQKISATVGPTVTLYEIIPAEGVRISKIRNLEDDIALNLAALGIRIIAPIPGKGTIGIEVPNASKQIVAMRTLLSSEKFVNNKMSLPIALGKLINNENYIVDLATMPHLLMAGATGQGKSVGINAILVSLLYKKHPSQLKFVMVDPKKVELSIYRTIEKHFLAKLPNEEEAIITDTKKVINTLNALCIEMDDRYELLKQAGARNIKEYNDKFIARKLNPENGHKFLPFIVLVVDEFADLIMTAGKEVEMPIARLAQLARAIGIHLIVATQRPSVNVITGTIKANFPARIAFKVSAKVDSRTILDAGGAEQLIGRGDMLISHGSELLRIQCAFVDTPEVEAIVDFIGRQRGYPHAFELPEYEGDDSDGEAKSIDLGNRDKLFEDCARIVVNSQSGSTSNLQRKMNLGYNRAGRIMDQLEAAGIVGPAVGSKPREVYFSTVHELEQMLDTL